MSLSKFTSPFKSAINYFVLAFNLNDMVFILSDERDKDLRLAFKNYQAYLESVKSSFPPSAYALATSDWYFNFNDHRCPHDAWLQNFIVSEIRKEDQPKQIEIKISLLGAYHDQELNFTYLDVSRYLLEGMDLKDGHSDWRYDEFRLSDSGKVIHEIEWCKMEDTGRFLIEASDVIFEAKEIKLRVSND